MVVCRTPACMAQGNGSEALSFDINLTAAQGAPDYCGVFWNNVGPIIFLYMFIAVMSVFMYSLTVSYASLVLFQFLYLYVLNAF